LVKGAKVCFSFALFAKYPVMVAVKMEAYSPSKRLGSAKMPNAFLARKGRPVLL
jgi:hypothetical protein